MGCLKAIFSIVIFIFAYIGFVSVGGDKFVSNLTDNFINPPIEKSIEKAKNAADFSKMSNEYKIEKAYDVAGAQAVIVKAQKNNQTMVFVSPSWIGGISKQNFEITSIDSQLEILKNKFNIAPTMKINNLEIIEKAVFKAMGQDVPYVKVKFNLSNNVEKKEGIIGAVENTKKETKLILSYNDEGKYNQKETERFFKGINLY